MRYLAAITAALLIAQPLSDLHAQLQTVPAFPFEDTSAADRALAARDCLPADAEGCFTYRERHHGELRDLWANAFTTPANRALMLQIVKANTQDGGIRWDKAKFAYLDALSSQRVAAELAKAPRTPVPTAARSHQPGRCWVDYCPCDEEDMVSRGICRDLRGGIRVSNEMMSAGAHARDAKKALDDFQQKYPD